ncbi:MFS transporter [Bellilinea sp.]|uniref:MFS transporter n=1 Tax=Bellilinea sp. TaxID=2838785 RepID=UPI002ADE58D8|nr:MFS transporter [Bellilinea sp.]
MKTSSPPKLGAQVAVFTLIRSVLNTSYRMVYPYLSLFQSGLGVGLPAISLVLSLRSLIAFAGPFLSPIADRYGRRVSMLLGMGLFTIGALTVVVLPTYTGFAISLPLMALAYMIFLPAMQAYLGDRVAYERRGRVMGITELSWSLSFIIGVPLVGVLLGRSGAWQSPFLPLALLGALSMVAVWRILPPHNRRTEPSSQSGVPPLPLGLLLRSAPARAGLLTILLLTAANETVNLVFGLWLEQRFNFQLAALGAAAVLIGLSEMGGEGLSAALVDRLGKVWSVRAGLLVNMLAAVVMFVLGGQAWGALAGLFLFYLSFEFSLVSLLPLMSEALPALRATVMASTLAMAALGRALGTQFAPLLFNGVGIGGNLIAALAMNLLAVWLVRQVRVNEAAPAVTPAD